MIEFVEMRAECRQKRLIVGLAVSRRSVAQCRISQPQTRVDAVAGCWNDGSGKQDRMCWPQVGLTL